MFQTQRNLTLHLAAARSVSHVVVAQRNASTLSRPQRRRVVPGWPEICPRRTRGRREVPRGRTPSHAGHALFTLPPPLPRRECFRRSARRKRRSPSPPRVRRGNGGDDLPSTGSLSPPLLAVSDHVVAQAGLSRPPRDAGRSHILGPLPCLVRPAVRATDGRNAVTEQDDASEAASEMTGGRQARPSNKDPARSAAR